jgi:hypothetical protein
MKVLYLSGATGADFQCDMLFHGLRTLLGADCVDVNKLTFMYQGEPHPPFFTVYALLPDIPIDRENIVEKLQNRYYDAVIYGSIQRCQAHFNLVRAVYPREKIAMVDGEDDGTIASFVGHGFYFKRELQVDDPAILPIQFAVPAQKVRQIDLHRKKRLMAPCDPRDRSTYKYYGDESAYYDQYSDSWFGYTMKKGGWDCCRHYEIIAAGCLPYFAGLEDCPPRTLWGWPRGRLFEARKLLDHGWNNTEAHEKYWVSLLEGIRGCMDDVLTTEACAKRVLEYLSD